MLVGNNFQILEFSLLHVGQECEPRMETGFSLHGWDTVGTDPSVCAHCWTSVGASLPLRRLCLSFVSSLDSAGFHVMFFVFASLRLF